MYRIKLTMGFRCRCAWNSCNVGSRALLKNWELFTILHQQTLYRVRVHL